MNLRKSIKVALAERDMIQKDLASKLCMSQSAISQLAKQTSCSSPMLNKLADAFDLKVSEFIALGED